MHAIYARPNVVEDILQPDDKPSKRRSANRAAQPNMQTPDTDVIDQKGSDSMFLAIYNKHTVIASPLSSATLVARKAASVACYLMRIMGLSAEQQQHTEKL